MLEIKDINKVISKIALRKAYDDMLPRKIAG